MQGAIVGLFMLCAVGVLAGAPQEIAAHPEAMIAAAHHNADAVLAFARGAFTDVPDLHRYINACTTDVASAACNR